MRQTMKAVACALAVGFAAQAWASWTYDASTKVITSGEWELNTDGKADGLTVTGVKAAGGGVLDLQVCETPDAPAIIAFAEYAFNRNADAKAALQELYMPDTVLTVGHSGFRDCSKLTVVKLSANIQNPGSCGFMGCGALKTVYPFLPPTVTSADATFNGCGSLTGDLVIASKSITELASQNHGGFGTFAGTKITSADLSESSIVLLQPRTFFNVTTLKWVKFPKTLETVEWTMFYGCSSLTELSFLSYPAMTATDNLSGTPAMPNARITFPANNSGWISYFNANASKVLWEDAGTSNTNTYNAKFTDGLVPLGYAPFCNVNKWFVPVPVEVKDVFLAIEGYPVKCGAVEPAYRDEGVLVDGPVTCTAPQYGFLPSEGYECVGYRIGKLVGTVVEYGELVPSREVTFNETEPGSYSVRWEWVNVAHRVTYEVDASLGTVEIPEPTVGGEPGYYLTNSVITLKAVAADDSPFGRWYGDIGEEDRFSGEISLTVDKPKFAVPYFARNWVLSGGTITDGYWKFNVSGSLDALTIGLAASSNPNVGMLDFSKPVKDADGVVGAFVAVAQNSCKNATAQNVLVDLVLPDTVLNLGHSSFRDCGKLKTVKMSANIQNVGGCSFMGDGALRSVMPFLPPTVTAVDASFNGCGSLTGDLVIASKSITELASQGSSFGSFAGTQITSADLSESSIVAVRNRTFISASKLKWVKFPKTLESIDGPALNGCGSLMDIWFRSFPTNFATSTDLLTSTPHYGRIVYPRGDAGWTAYLDANTNGNFTAWADAGSRTNDYLKAFSDHWKPIGYMKIHPGNNFCSNNIRWMVPHNFGTGMKLLFR